ncbi:MAG: STAS domain-containing protein [Sedimentisphaerales bacterium]|nr:STAS domain-containing protein [Sedimentisphaerales bacterium]
MKIQTQDYNDVTVIELQGDFDSDYTELFKNAVLKVVSQNKQGIVVDMASVGFIDSQGLEQLLWARDYCNQNNTQLKLAALDEKCRNIFQVTRLELEFDDYSEVAQAAKSFA